MTATKTHAGRTFDRVPQWDDRNENYPARTLIATHKPRSYTWRCDTHLDQGREGACVGHAFAHDVAARPDVRPADSPLAFTLYRRAQQLDPWPGEAYEGTSVLAGAKAMLEAGYLSEYRWAMSVDDVVDVLGYHGPVVLGVNWYAGMFDPDANGYLHPTGSVLGGHAILARAVSVKREDVTLHNSWGPGWGVNGTARITFADLERLLAEDGEACVPVVRR